MKKTYITPEAKNIEIEEESLLNGWSTDDGCFGKDYGNVGDPEEEAT